MLLGSIFDKMSVSNLQDCHLIGKFQWRESYLLLREFFIVHKSSFFSLASTFLALNLPLKSRFNWVSTLKCFGFDNLLAVIAASFVSSFKWGVVLGASSALPSSASYFSPQVWGLCCFSFSVSHALSAYFSSWSIAC